MTTTANDILMGGGGAPSVQLTEGVTVTGRIVNISEPYQEREYDKANPGNGPLKFFKNGNPIMTFNIDLATDQRDPSDEDDDGTRRLYMDGARIKKAVRAAVQQAGAPGLQVGGTLTITCTHYDVPGDIRSGKNYAVQYQPGSPANSVLMGQQEPPQPAPAAPQPAPNPWNQQAQPAPAAPAPQPTPQPAPQAAPAAPQMDMAALLAAMQNAGMTIPGQQG